MKKKLNNIQQMDCIKYLKTLDDNSIEEFYRISNENYMSLDTEDKKFIDQVHEHYDNWDSWEPITPIEEILKNAIGKIAL